MQFDGEAYECKLYASMAHDQIPMQNPVACCMRDSAEDAAVIKCVNCQFPDELVAIAAVSA